MRRVRAAAERVELEMLLDRRPAQLSGGQRQRVALGRAIVRTPQLFLMDEPLSNLDAKLRVSMRAQLKHLQRELNTTTIYVTHDQVEAMTLADRVAVMSAGKLQQVGPPLEIYNRPANAFVAAFLGNPSMNLIDVNVAGGRAVHPSFSLPASALSPGKVTLGERPEDMAIVAPGAGDFDTEVYTAELLGDTALVTVRLGPKLLAVKAEKDTPVRMGDNVGVRFNRDALHFFDATTGAGALWWDRPMAFANGMVLSEDGRSLYVVETFGRRVSRIAIGDDGAPAGIATYVENLPGLPDGLALDRAGRLYISCYEPSRILRAPVGGGSVEIFAEDVTAHLVCHPTNIAFSGSALYAANLGRWHITRIETGVDAESVVSQVQRISGTRS